MAQVKFYRGKKEDYSEVDHIDGVYFATDTEEVVMNGKEYGKDPDWNEIESVSPLTKVWFVDGTIQEIDLDSIYSTEFYNPSNQFVQSAKNITKIEIGSNVTNIGQSAFYGCSGLTSIIIPNSVTSIDNNAFNGCSGLTSVTIPNSVTSIGNNAFSGCIGLTSIYCNSVNEPCSVYNGTFFLNNANIIGALYVKKGGSASTYPTWLNTMGNLGWSGAGTWSVVEYFD